MHCRSPLAADARLPGRDALLDEHEIPARISRLLGLDGPVSLDGYGRGRVAYDVGSNLRVVHELLIGRTPRIVASRTVTGGGSARVYERALATATASAPLRGAAHDPELDTVFWSFPNDPGITTLRALDPATGVLPALLGRPIARSALVAYEPEVSATAACFEPGASRPVAYATVHAPGDRLGVAHLAHGELSACLHPDDPYLRLPGVLGHSEPEQMLVLEGLRGRRLDALRASDRFAGMRALGAALATLHALPLPHGLPAFAAGDHARAADLVAAMRPDVAARAAQVAHELGEHGLVAGEPPVCLHGDAQLRNGILQDERVALIGLGAACSGPAAADLGAIVAQLRYQSLVSGDLARGRRLEHALLDGYRSRRRPPSGEELRRHVAAALLCKQAMCAIDRVRVDGLALIPAVLDEAHAVLSEDLRV